WDASCKSIWKICCCDDSDGIVGGIIDESIASIDHIVSTYIDTMSESTHPCNISIIMDSTMIHICCKGVMIHSL
ncbi:hypothetical protein ACT4UT_14175, partial [Bacillus sp. B-TM1]